MQNTVAPCQYHKYIIVLENKKSNAIFITVKAKRTMDEAKCFKQLN